jgi:hypothetical protein
MRRLTASVIVLVALLLVTVAAAGVAAQDPSEHPAIGAWIVDATPEDATDPPGLLTLAPGGILIDADPEWTAYGSWAATGDLTADATFLFPFADPECGCLVGYGTIRASLDVAEDGQSFTGTYTIEPPAGVAEAMGLPVGQFGPGEVTAQRIAVEAMGEPVGPIPDEPPAVESPAPVESPPAPEVSPMAPHESPAD